MTAIFIPQADLKKIKKQYPEAVEVSTRAEGVVDLPRMPNGQMAPTFEANGKQYTILDPEDGIGIKRYTELQKMLIPAQHGFSSFKAMYDYWTEEAKKLMTMSGEGTIKIALADSINNFKRNISEIDNDRFLQSVRICTVFIVAEGEDTAKYSRSEAERKIEDWAKANINVLDFFVLALGRLSDFSNAYQQELNKIPEEDRPRVEDTGLSTVLTGGKK